MATAGVGGILSLCGGERDGIVRALKFLVIAMGLVLIAGFAVIAFEIVRRSGAGPDAPETVSETTPAPGREPFGATLGLPQGARIGAIAATATQIVVLVRMSDGADRLMVLDPETGAIAGTFLTGTR